VSNAVAQSLYHKYEFINVGTKPNYYRADNEDAYDMRLDLTDELMLARFDQRFADLRARLPFNDQYTEVPSPKKKPG
jgi:hypothetical protein